MSTGDVMVRAVLLSTYELGRQPFGLASPASWLRDAGVEVACFDLAVDSMTKTAIRDADLIAFYVPMHTATRIAIAHLDRIRSLNRRTHLCFFGLYGPVNERYLRALGVDTILGGEFEQGLVALATRLGASTGKPAWHDQPEPLISLSRQEFKTPSRADLPGLERYAKVDVGDGRQRTVGYTEATRGCKHTCSHCPIVPVYGGRFRVVQRDVVLADIRQQVAAGAEHMTFGDPDFFNGPTHAVSIVRALHDEFPVLTYDVTIKIEHLRKQAALLTTLRDTGCLFVTSAVEAVDSRSLAAYQKNHTKQDFIDVVDEFRRIGLHLNPTFVTFSPWTTLDSYAELLRVLRDLSLVHNVSPIQYAIRLLIPAKSMLLDRSDVQDVIEPFDERLLVFPWRNHDPRVDALYESVRELIERATDNGYDRASVFSEIWRLTRTALGSSGDQLQPHVVDIPEPQRPVPFLTEPWYCCAEPTDAQLAGAFDPLV